VLSHRSKDIAFSQSHLDLGKNVMRQGNIRSDLNWSNSIKPCTQKQVMREREMGSVFSHTVSNVQIDMIVSGQPVGNMARI